jgi:hypothetical protein
MGLPKQQIELYHEITSLYSRPHEGEAEVFSFWNCSATQLDAITNRYFCKGDHHEQLLGTVSA